MRRFLRTLVGLLAGCVVAVFLPVIPATSLSDPEGHADPRVTARVSDEDVRQIILILRRGRLNSIYEIVRYHTRAPLLRISTSLPTWHVSPGPAREEPPTGDITATVGFRCGPLCGSGINYSLKRGKNEWLVVEVSEWVS